MVPPVRWYYILSTWIFILSVLYPVHKISTYPLILLASVGCLEVVVNPYKENMVKNIYILFIHIAPFFWIPYSFAKRSLVFAATVILLYFCLLFFLGENVFHVYGELLDEGHSTPEIFICHRFGIC